MVIIVLDTIKPVKGMLLPERRKNEVDQPLKATFPLSWKRNDSSLSALPLSYVNSTQILFLNTHTGGYFLDNPTNLPLVSGDAK